MCPVPCRSHVQPGAPPQGEYHPEQSTTPNGVPPQAGQPGYHPKRGSLALHSQLRWSSYRRLPGWGLRENKPRGWEVGGWGPGRSHRGHRVAGRLVSKGDAAQGQPSTWDLTEPSPQPPAAKERSGFHPTVQRPDLCARTEKGVGPRLQRPVRQEPVPTQTHRGPPAPRDTTVWRF